MKHSVLTAVVIASLYALVGSGTAIELGELQALPSSHPPYIFRLAIKPPARGLADIPAVRIRHPQDALSFVRNNLLELRLRSLADVELEVSQSGQTLNRLLLHSELQAARARLEAGTAPIRQQPPQTIGRDVPTAPAPPAATTHAAAPRSLLEREAHAIRQEIQYLVGQVTPWEARSTSAEHTVEHTRTPVVVLILWGLFVAAVASSCTAYAMQCRAAAHEQHRRLALLESMRWLRREGTAWATAPLASLGGQRVGDQPHALARSTGGRHVRVSQRVRRRVRVRALKVRRDASHAPGARLASLPTHLAQTRTSAPAEVVEALGNLRRELMRLQGLLPTSTIQDPSPSPRDSV